MWERMELLEPMRILAGSTNDGDEFVAGGKLKCGLSNGLRLGEFLK